ncbi:MFS general substrate transporter [Daldinia caldariorum]|uniref:MFS general substrate transporter n=1 Tax=Daldinia caldariorum TaxID=326644 RepID=UPI00200811B2|nr:MFS general substrate transporter [Daldinia caldariorum]KAI1469667.1 MFS general substrate transporter [Daldinia caldariorum]
MASNNEIADFRKTVVGHHEYCTDKELPNVPDRADAMVTTPEPTLESFADLDEKKILRKMDLRLIPMLAILYLLSFLDRGNIGNAKIEGLQEDLRMSPDEYNWCLTVFFFTYATFEVPSNLLLKKLRPSRWLPLIMVAAMFFSAASVAGAFSGLLAFAIAKMDGVGNLEGWRWIFILEGIATILVAVLAFFVLYDFPETASFLTEKERAFIVFRLKYQGQQQRKEHVQVAQAEEFEWKYVLEAFKDWQIWVNLFVYWGVVCPLYGISLFLPTIIRNLGYSSSTAQLMTVPIYVTAAILSVVFAFLSDRVGKRSPFVISFFLIMIVGFSMCVSSTNPRVVYGGVFIVACAIYPAFPGVVTWLSNNLAGSYKRSAGMAIQIGIGNLGGAMASNFYRQADSPQYILGHGLELGFIGVGVIAAVILVVAYTAINKKRDRIIRDGGEEQFTAQELSAKGDKAVTFRYMI